MTESRNVQRLLYVEDNEDNLYMLSLFFDVQGGYEILSAASGAEGIASAIAEQPDLILMDLNLPEIDGWEATRRLKADPALTKIPVIVLSAHAMRGDEERARAAGCDHYLAKPISPKKVVEEVRKLLDRS